ncbi:MAG: AAA family ATPase [Deltaproteobacteria bacterium]|nr:AAA family ATPase [Deltaproteobacteria bacterium]
MSNPKWVVDYWQSALATDPFRIQNFSAPNPRVYLSNAFAGNTQNSFATNLICYIDYLRDSRDNEEQKVGELLWQALSTITEKAINDGALSHIARSTFSPIFKHRNREISIEKLSAGSLYFIQRMLGLLGKMYSCYMVSNNQSDNLLNTPGLLLIDEPENHLHPKWQKKFLPIIRAVFPNIQIIAATHSPFIVASSPEARVFVCRAKDQTCEVVDVTRTFANEPVDEVLMSDAFSATPPFSEKITQLLYQRNEAIKQNNKTEREKIEKELLSLNQEAFAWLRIDSLLNKVSP